MTIRMTGMMSGLDTDAIIKELMSAQSMKKTKIEKKKTKTEWKQEKWKELNTKIYNLYTKQVSKMKLQGAYLTKKVTSSNEDAVTATATSSAATGSHKLEVIQLASSQYVTSGKVAEGIKSSTKLTDSLVGMTEGTKISVKVGTGDDVKSVELEVKAETTVNDFVKHLQNAGLNASFDEKQGRFFISSKESGDKNKFTITASETSELSSPLKALGLAQKAEKVYEIENGQLVAGVDSNGNNFYINSEGKYVDAKGQYVNKYGGKTNVSLKGVQAYEVDENGQLIAGQDAKGNNYYINSDGYYVNSSGAYVDSSGAYVDSPNDDNSMTVIEATNAIFKLDGAELTETSNNFTVAGITLDLKNETKGEVSLNVTNNADAVYDSFKEFIKEYNSILKEMNDLYGADSAKGYEPLTDEEKEAMSEEQIELWEKKIKDSLLRRDSTLSSLTSAMRTAMQSFVEVDGKNYSLSSFGIMTSSDYTEKGLLHIYGDPDDEDFASETDKLKAAIMEDPDTVAKVLSGIVTKLADVMADKMKGTQISSALTFYNDKEMKNQIKGYEDEIDKWEDRLLEMEDRYYKQFSAMESAMAKLNSQSSYFASMMGMGQ